MQEEDMFTKLKDNITFNIDTKIFKIFKQYFKKSKIYKRSLNKIQH